MVCRKMAQAYTNRNVKIRVSFFAETQNYSNFNYHFHRPVINSSATAMKGPDTSADAYVWPVWSGLSTEKRQKLQNSSRICFSKLKKLCQPKKPRKIWDVPGVMGSGEVRLSTPKCMGYVKIHIFSQSRKKNIFFAKNPKISRFLFPIFSTTNERRVVKLSRP